MTDTSGPEEEAPPAVPATPGAPAGVRARRSRLRRAAVGAVAVLVLLLLVNAFAVQPYRITSGSMENTLRVGDRVLVNKLAYRFGDTPGRGDVVVFDGTGTFAVEDTGGTTVSHVLRTAGALVGLAEPPGNDYVKRVVGVGGDRVTCCDEQGRIEVNGEPLTEDYLHPEGGDARASTVDFDIVVPPGRLWVMGDHRADSRDSRDHLGRPGGGTVPVEDVIGRVEWVGWPADRWAWLRTAHG
ncbi:signal peptidase I [Streptomyces sp. JJ38]|uniref:signal peptidase I n=1 Tax=Streptomyces sp. JJ38 TaxID=2738128 RepID=UPI001C5913A3|nr:signal peptidase I [Streptomyces sp. JJ38]MBW1598183.1 signal peptidase I [Streptomyces sp. JJ38]